MKDFRKLIVWEKAHQLTLKIYKVTEHSSELRNVWVMWDYLVVRRKYHLLSFIFL